MGSSWNSNIRFLLLLSQPHLGVEDEIVHFVHGRLWTLDHFYKLMLKDKIDEIRTVRKEWPLLG